jgi:hypothetical protein
MTDLERRQLTTADRIKNLSHYIADLELDGSLHPGNASAIHAQLADITSDIEAAGLVADDEATVERLALALAGRFYDQTIDTATMPENWKRWRELSDQTKAKEANNKARLARFVLDVLRSSPPAEPS